MSAMFLVTRNTLTESEVKKIDDIAARLGVDFVYIGKQAHTQPTTGWFTCRDFGQNFTDARASDVRDALRKDGLAKAYGLEDT